MRYNDRTKLANPHPTAQESCDGTLSADSTTGKTLRTHFCPHPLCLCPSGQNRPEVHYQRRCGRDAGRQSGHCQVWSSDIIYIHMRRGYVYLVAVIDWLSRYVLAWQLSNSLTGDVCLDVLEQALLLETPEIFKTDQGSQFTARAFTSRLDLAGIQISMDGRGWALGNIFIERLWRSVVTVQAYSDQF